jgi:hypothetical protein
MYPYIVPPGMGDSFYIYVVNGEDIPIANGNSYSLLGVTVEDADFIWRAWSGAALLLADGGTVQVYDGARNAFFQLPIIGGGGMFPPALAILPEKRFRNNTALRFDLVDVELNVNTNGTASVYADQMAWYGVKRNPGGIMDPGPSQYKYYEKPFSYPFSLSIDNYGPSGAGGLPIPGLAVPAHYTQLVTDFDFELRRIGVSVAGEGTFAHISLVELGEIFVLDAVAVTAGVAGNNIEIVIISPGTTSTPLSVAVVGTVITVTMATDGLGNSISDSSDIVDAINADPPAAALVTATGTLSPAPIPDSVSGFLTGGTGGAGTSAYASTFKILLYDATWRQRTSIPILSELLCHNPSTGPPKSSMPNNAWPSPPLLYPVNSVIRFDIFSLIPTGDALPVSVQLTFEGVRRINC